MRSGGEGLLEGSNWVYYSATKLPSTRPWRPGRHPHGCSVYLTGCPARAIEWQEVDTLRYRRASLLINTPRVSALAQARPCISPCQKSPGRTGSSAKSCTPEWSDIVQEHIACHHSEGPVVRERDSDASSYHASSQYTTVCLRL